MVPIVVDFQRNPLFPDAPAIVEFSNNALSLQVLKLQLAPQDMDRPFLAPPGTPPERVAALRKAFHAAVNDPGFRAEAARMGLEVSEIPGEKVASILGEVYALPPDVVNVAREAMNASGVTAE
ncbi:MAG: hypothetical protein QOG83_2579 [Alphaproteobacteria bacterium]|nr:hypothetical protein [Alphaproteobacteria bacterium]